MGGAGLAGHPLGRHGDAAGGGGVGAERQPAGAGRRRQKAGHAHGAAAPKPARRRHRHCCLLADPEAAGRGDERREGGQVAFESGAESAAAIKSTSTSTSGRRGVGAGWGYPNAARHWPQYLSARAPLGHVGSRYLWPADVAWPPLARGEARSNWMLLFIQQSKKLIGSRYSIGDPLVL